MTQGPTYGEDSAALEHDFGKMVVSTDPIVFASDMMGRLAVDVASNDVAAFGGRPEWISNTLFVRDRNELKDITEQIDEGAKRLGVSIIGGHSEYNHELNRPFISMTCIGPAERFVPTSGAKPGDKIILTKESGIEGSSIMARDFEDAMRGKVDEITLKRARERLRDISIIPEAKVLSPLANSMHDPTEGGVINGLLEMAISSEVTFIVEDIPLSEESEKICQFFDLDPLKVFASGSLAATAPEKVVEKVIAKLEERDIKAKVIGEVREGGGKLIINEDEYREPISEETYKIW